MWAYTDGDSGCDSLEEFTESLSKFTHYSSLRVLATLSYATDIYNTSSIVSRLCWPDLSQLLVFNVQLKCNSLGFYGFFNVLSFIVLSFKS